MTAQVNPLQTDESETPTTLELQVLPATDLTDHASVRSFVRSESYHRIIGRVLCSEAPSLSPEEDERARGMAMLLNWDLATLAQAAAGPELPLVVTQARQEDRPGIVRDLGMVGRAITLSEGWASPPELQRELFRLIDHHESLIDAEKHHKRSSGGERQSPTCVTPYTDDPGDAEAVAEGR